VVTRTATLLSILRRIGKLEDSDLPTVVARLEALVEDDHEHAFNLLWQLGHALTTLNGTIRTTLQRFFRQGNSATRGLCLQVFANTKDREMCRCLLAEKWTAQEVEEDYEGHWGSISALRRGVSDVPFVEIAKRVAIPLLGYAVQCRGSRQEEVTAYGDLIYGIWRGITLRQPERYPDVVAHYNKDKPGWSQVEKRGLGRSATIRAAYTLYPGIRFGAGAPRRVV